MATHREGVLAGERCWRDGTCGGSIRISPLSEFAYCSVCGWDEGSESPQLRVAAAAVRFGPLILSMPPPARHHTILQSIALLGGDSCVRLGDQGFLLSDGTFAQRKPALIVATEAGQLVQNPNAHSSPISPPSLFSEDMW